ncbi:MAG: DNA-3-methyladenine glycosylase 2 family protein [Hyphomicrobiaceae bacterium]|nr:DNA-3-methyladenine glycosylase 2 family protein [Hyphomicrobiaceae bacterium]
MRNEVQSPFNARSAHVVLSDEAALEEAIAQLSRQCRIMRRVHARTGTPPLRDFPADFSGLAKIVVGQQLSASSAAAIWGRLSQAVRPFKAAKVLAMSDAELRAPGLSAGKIRTLRALADAVTAKHVVFSRLNGSPENDVISTLTQIHGVGPWTAEIYLLFALRRADAFPCGDLALQLAAQNVMKLDAKPTPPELRDISERWRPWRGAAARLLWADYALQRSVTTARPTASRSK